MQLEAMEPGRAREVAERALAEGKYWRAMEAANAVQRLGPEEFGRLSEAEKRDALRASAAGQKAAEGVAELHDELARYRENVGLEELWEALPEQLRDRFKVAFMDTPDVDDETFLAAYDQMREQLGV